MTSLINNSKLIHSIQLEQSNTNGQQTHSTMNSPKKSQSYILYIEIFREVKDELKPRTKTNDQLAIP